MKQSLVLKAVAIILAAVALTVAAGGALGMVVLSEAGLYKRTVEEVQRERVENITSQVADSLVEEYIEVHLSNANEEMLRHSSFYSDSHDYYWYEFNDRLGMSGWGYTIAEVKDNKVVESGGAMAVGGSSGQDEAFTVYEHRVSMNYPKLLNYTRTPEKDKTETTAATTPGNTQDGPTVSFEATTPVEVQYDDCYTWYNEETGIYYDYYLRWEQSPEYLVSISLPEGFVAGYSEGYWQMLILLQKLQAMLLPCLLIGIVVFAAAVVYLVLAAGHRRDTAEVRPGGLNAIPLDLYTAAAVGGSILLVMAGAVLTEWAVEANAQSFDWGLMVLAVLPFLGAALLIVGYLFALAAQFKAGSGYWWRKSVIGRLLIVIGRGLRWLWHRGLRLLSMMGAMWQWMVTALVLGALVFLLGMVLAVAGNPFWLVLFVLALLACAGVTFYGAYAFGVILEGARRMARGDLNRQVPTKFLVGCFADCANQLNALADVAVEAAQKQLKSDRMKTELITNVSHDIKTPLTSIINYVDLLQKPHTEQQGVEYLAVLARQSGRLKKLIEDLMDMSKATTGNMAVEISNMDAVEAVNQALGEFSDKLEAAALTPVVRHPESPVMIRADGRLVWRTLSNLLQNAVKYALPGTRLYVDIAQVEGSVVISLKNISREELNISADELMERFVRGDASRNTEGSGLGLNIAKSLMELQRGQLRLLVDGDLFKTSMIFPAGE